MASSPSPSLDELGIRLNTDKSSLQHDYLNKYERLFAPMRNHAITVLEIGIAQGASLNLWEQFFPKATIVGIDIQERCKRFEGGRKKVEIASQADPEALASLGKKYEPSIIIDDGSHLADHIVISLEALFPILRAGGLYVVEDLGMHFGANADRHRGAAQETPQQYLSRLALGACGTSTSTGAERAIIAELEGIEFFHSAAVLRKKAAPQRNRLELRRRIVSEMDSDRAWGWYSGYVSRNGGEAKESIDAAKRAVELAPKDASHHRQLVEALEHAGQFDEALVVARTAAERWPHMPAFPAAASRLTTKMARVANKQNERPAKVSS
jgi:tetratricopeptide (TPR) repeat protein